MSRPVGARDVPAAQPVKDPSTVDVAGTLKQELIEGVVVRSAVVHADARGTLCEIYNPAWGVHPAPLVYVYQFTIRPGMVKGWHKHHLHDDRIFLSQGTIKVVLYDDRPESRRTGWSTRSTGQPRPATSWSSLPTSSTPTRT